MILKRVLPWKLSHKYWMKKARLAFCKFCFFTWKIFLLVNGKTEARWDVNWMDLMIELRELRETITGFKTLTRKIALGKYFYAVPKLTFINNNILFNLVFFSFFDSCLFLNLLNLLTDINRVLIFQRLLDFILLFHLIRKNLTHFYLLFNLFVPVSIFCFYF